MEKATRQFLNNLEAVDWFADCGKPVSSKNIRRALSWSEALEFVTSSNAVDNFQRAVNGFQVRVRDKSKRDFQKWNQIVAGLDPFVKNLAETKTTQAFERLGLLTYFQGRDEHDLEMFKNHVETDIFYAAMEIEFGYLCRPDFFSDVAEWYLKRHLSCGWAGDYPNVSLVVF